MFEDQEVGALSAIASTTNHAAGPVETTCRAQQDPGSLSISPTGASVGTTLVSREDVTTEIAPGIDETPSRRTRSSRKSKKGVATEDDMVIADYVAAFSVANDPPGDARVQGGVLAYRCDCQAVE